MTRIVILDGYTLNPGDLDWAGLAALGDLVVYDRTAPNITAAGMELPGFATVGLRFGVQKGDRWGLYVFANNVFDVIGAVNKTTSATSSVLAPVVSNGVTYPSVYVTSSPPRVIGLSLRTRF